MVMTEPQAPDRAKSELFILPLKEGAPECILGEEALEGPRAGAPAPGTCAGCFFFGQSCARCNNCGSHGVMLN